MPIVLWKCNECGNERQAGLKPPEGWLEISFWNGYKFIRHSFCSYRCATSWCGKRYDLQPKSIKS